MVPLSHLPAAFDRRGRVLAPGRRPGQLPFDPVPGGGARRRAAARTPDRGGRGFGAAALAALLLFAALALAAPFVFLAWLPLLLGRPWLWLVCLPLALAGALAVYAMLLGGGRAAARAGASPSCSSACWARRSPRREVVGRNPRRTRFVTLRAEGGTRFVMPAVLSLIHLVLAASLGSGGGRSEGASARRVRQRAAGGLGGSARRERRRRNRDERRGRTLRDCRAACGPLSSSPSTWPGSRSRSGATLRCWADKPRRWTPRCTWRRRPRWWSPPGARSPTCPRSDPGQELAGIASAASSGVIAASQIEDRSLLRPADVLERVPGPGGQPAQRRGEGATSTTSAASTSTTAPTWRSTVAGVPVNLPTHAHGQGYADANFLIPELVERDPVPEGPLPRRARRLLGGRRGQRRLPEPARSAPAQAGGRRGRLRARAPRGLARGWATATCCGAVEARAQATGLGEPRRLSASSTRVLRYSRGPRHRRLQRHRPRSTTADWNSTDQIPPRATLERPALPLRDDRPDRRRPGAPR